MTLMSTPWEISYPPSRLLIVNWIRAVPMARLFGDNCVTSVGQERPAWLQVEATSRGSHCASTKCSLIGVPMVRPPTDLTITTNPDVFHDGSERCLQLNSL